MPVSGRLQGPPLDGDIEQYSRSVNQWVLTQGFAGLSTQNWPYNYWVSTGPGASDTNNGGIADPFATLPHAVAVGEATGQPYTVNLGAGTFVLPTLDANGNGLTTNQAGARIVGSGALSTVVQLGPGLSANWIIQNTSGFSVVKDLHITIGAGASAVYSVGVDTATSAEECLYENLLIDNTSTYGIGVSPTHHADVAETTIRHNYVTNAGVAGSANCIINDGAAGNVLNTRFYDNVFSNGTYGIHSRSAPYIWVGGTCQKHIDSDFYLYGANPAGPIVIQGVRSEGSARLVHTGANSPIMSDISIEDAVFSGDAIAADGFWIYLQWGGPIHIRRVFCAQTGSVTPSVLLDDNGGHQAVCIAEGLAQPTPIASAFTFGGTSNTAIAIAIGYQQYSNSTQVAVSATPLWIRSATTNPPLQLDQTGYLQISQNPTTNLGVAPKQYVDAITALPPPVTTGTTVQSFTSPSGETFVAKNGVSSGAWKLARDVLKCRVYRNAALTIPVAATTLSFDTISRDDYGMYVTNFNPPINGWYRFIAQLQGTGQAAGNYIQVTLTQGATHWAQNTLYSYGTGSFQTCVVADIVYLTVGQSVAVTIAASIATPSTVGQSTVYATFEWVGTG